MFELRLPVSSLKLKETTKTQKHTKVISIFMLYTITLFMATRWSDDSTNVINNGMNRILVLFRTCRDTRGEIWLNENIRGLKRTLSKLRVYVR